MTRTATLQYRPVDTIPRAIDEGVLYVSQEYATVVHKCCCGCGHEVVTPLGPTDWKIAIVGDAVSVYPSIGNWSLPCRSHYSIDRGHVRWAAQWSEAQISYGRARDRIAKQRLYGELPDAHAKPGVWARLWRWLTGR
ncbi:MAG TPA: DUF6527 family protein [Gammaproteobacteria bacterium]|nr:DUF6527 family protein [Gammaproteobacteria bacterium]